MPGWVLSARGREFDVDRFLLESPWGDCAETFYAGQASLLPSHPVLPSPGFQFGLSADMEENLRSQIQEATEFLQHDGAEIRRLAAVPGIESIDLRIGLFWRANTLCQSYTLPPGLMQLAGSLGVSVTLCIYASE